MIWLQKLQPNCTKGIIRLQSINIWGMVWCTNITRNHTLGLAGGTVGLLQLTYLRSYEVGGVAGCHEEPILRAQLLGEPEVTDAQAGRGTRLVRVEDIRRLQVSMYYLQIHVTKQISIVRGQGCWYWYSILTRWSLVALDQTYLVFSFLITKDLTWW